jgi:hypothetical protein
MRWVAETLRDFLAGPILGEAILGFLPMMP